MSKIKGENITLFFPKNEKPTLNKINFSVEGGKITVFLGMSGSGKTTLLKCMAGILNNHEGVITYNGVIKTKLTITQRIATIGYVSQHYQLFPHMTVYQNCVHPQKKVLGKTEEEAGKTTGRFLGQLDLIHLKDRYPSELSGGQQQRVAIARALGMGSGILLLDEPTSALDPESTRKLKALLLQLKKDGYTIAISSHDMAFAKAVMDNVFFMEEGFLVEAFQNKEFSKNSKTFSFLNNCQEDVT